MEQKYFSLFLSPDTTLNPGHCTYNKHTKTLKVREKANPGRGTQGPGNDKRMNSWIFFLSLGAEQADNPYRQKKSPPQKPFIFSQRTREVAAFLSLNRLKF